MKYKIETYAYLVKVGNTSKLVETLDEVNKIISRFSHKGEKVEITPFPIIKIEEIKVQQPKAQ